MIKILGATILLSALAGCSGLSGSSEGPAEYPSGVAAPRFAYFAPTEGSGGKLVVQHGDAVLSSWLVSEAGQLRSTADSLYRLDESGRMHKYPIGTGPASVVDLSEIEGLREADWNGSRFAVGGRDDELILHLADGKLWVIHLVERSAELLADRQLLHRLAGIEPAIEGTLYFPGVAVSPDGSKIALALPSELMYQSARDWAAATFVFDRRMQEARCVGPGSPLGWQDGRLLLAVQEGEAALEMVLVDEEGTPLARKEGVHLAALTHGAVLVVPTGDLRREARKGLEVEVWTTDLRRKLGAYSAAEAITSVPWEFAAFGP
jgi:hypothetical protein